MRRHQQRRILELLGTIKEAQTAQMYADCQDAAIGVGTFIEDIKGGGTQTVALLEEYCELLFKASNGEAGEKALRKHMVRIENSARGELKPDRIEIAFISYKASMSDSLESVYIAAKADPQCDAYWIPVPYFDKNNDGTLGEMRFDEASCYGAGIECTDWREYDIQARYPDAIFTFNPYDTGNLVTCIHPNFYCKRLRELTDCLVYIPYFVAPGDVEEHFCTTAGCVYAHKVILQSEKVRKAYIKAFKEAFGSKLGRPEDKFIALGSPKLDKALNTKREDCNLPEEWRELIGGRKAVLYNTTIGAILHGNEQYLQKLRSVLDAYRNRSDAALWWRPHPLIAGTLKSMRPHLLEEYEQIVSDYRRDAWGLYDETEDLHRSIACTDEYYGDWSSLVSMYAVTGKPVMIQKADVSLENSRQDALMFECSYDDGDFVWFAAYFWNALFKLDKKTWVAEYMGSFPDEPEHTWKLFTDVAQCNGKLYFAPCGAAKIAIYDIATGLFSAMDIKKPDKAQYPNYDANCKFSNVTQNGNHLYFLPATYPAIVMLEADSGETVYMTNWIKPLEEIRNEDTWYFFGVTVVFEKIYVSVRCADAVLVIDGLSVELIPLCLGNVNYGGICYDGNNYWLNPCRVVQGLPALIKWNENTGQTVVFHLNTGQDCVGLEEKLLIVFGILHRDGHIWVFPHHLEHSLEINISSERTRYAEAFQTECSVAAEPAIYNTYTKYWEKNGILYALGARSGAISIYNISTGDSSIETMTEECHRKIAKDARISNPGTAGETIYRAIIGNLAAVSAN